MRKLFDDKWLERTMALLGVTVLVQIFGSRITVLAGAAGVACLLFLAAFLVRLIVLIYRRSRGVGSRREDPRAVRRRERFYFWVGVIWFLLLLLAGFYRSFSHWLASF